MEEKVERYQRLLGFIEQGLMTISEYTTRVTYNIHFLRGRKRLDILEDLKILRFNIDTVEGYFKQLKKMILEEFKQ